MYFQGQTKDMNRRTRTGPRLALGLLFALGAPAAPAGNGVLETRLVNYLQNQTAHMAGEVAVEVTMPAVALAPCRSPQPFLPGRNTRLSGRITVGVQCPGGRPPTRYFQAYISIITPYYVAARPLGPGQLITHRDIKRATGDITRLSPHIATDAGVLVGKVTARRIAEGMPLTDTMVERQMVIKRGDRVRVIAEGTGFSITTEGQALGNAPIGGQVRVRTRGDTIVTGISRDGNTVTVQR